LTKLGIPRDIRMKGGKKEERLDYMIIRGKRGERGVSEFIYDATTHRKKRPLSISPLRFSSRSKWGKKGEKRKLERLHHAFRRIGKGKEKETRLLYHLH